MKLITPILVALLLAAPSLATADTATQPTPATRPTLWLVGDSTVQNNSKTERGWGSELGAFFDASRIAVENRAMGGRSSRTFLTEGRWDAILATAKPGDFVLIQLGHNDSGPLSGDDRERGSLPGTGEETKDVTLKLQNGKPETVHTYGWYIRKIVRDAKAKGMTPIVCSPIPHCPPTGKTIEPTTQPSGGYRLWAQQVAEQEQVPFIDLYALIWTDYVPMTPDKIKNDLFTPADNTHTSPAGAKFNAEHVIAGIRQLKDVPLASYLK